MGKLDGLVKRFLYRNMPLDAYLRTVSRLFFAGYRSGLARNSSAYEYPHFLKRLVSKGDTAIDIGANLGYYSRIISRLAGPRGKVYAVEPVKPILGVLEHNLRKCRNVEIFPFALGAEEREIRMGNDSARHTGYMGTGRNRVLESTSSPAEPLQCRAAVCREQPTEVTCDPETDGILEFSAEMRRGSELFGGLERLDFIKCDIEGYESVVIPEMASVIERFRPVVLIETGGANRAAMKEFFGSRGYAGFVLRDGRLVPHTEVQGEKDIVFIPGHRLTEFESLTDNLKI